MRIGQIVSTLFLLLSGGLIGAYAQSAVSVGDQVTAEANIAEGTPYILKTGADRFITDNGTNYDVPNNANSATEASVYYFVSNGDGTWKIKNYYTNKFWGVPVYNAALAPVEESAAGAWTLNFSDGIAYPTAPDADGTTRGIDRSSGKVWGWTTGTNNNHKVYIYQVREETFEPTAGEVYTINHSSRGAMMHNSSTSYVWSSGKSGTFNASDANCQWILYPTGSNATYYLYNVGAQKFAIPSGAGSTASWVFSSGAVAVMLVEQSDGTFKIKTATSDVYAAVSNGYDGPIINYNDQGGNFNITKVSDTGSSVTAQVNAAVNKLICKQTALSSAISTDGWYAIRVKTHGSYADHYVFTSASEIDYNGTNYALNFYTAYKLQPAIDNAQYLFRITPDGSGFDWQMPNGRYLYQSSGNKYPVSTADATAVNFPYDTNGFRLYGGSRYAVPYLLNSAYFMGETSNGGNAYYDIYPVSLADAGLAAWQVLCDEAPAATQVSCSRSDVAGLANVYKNGYFFLPADVTPTADDFSMAGATSYTIDATAKTITIAYDPSIAIVADGVEVYQGYGTTGRGNEKAVLLRIKATPVNAMENAVMAFTLTNPSYISGVKVYETGNNVEFNAISTYTNTFNGTVSDATASVTLGSVSPGTHYYWLCATIADDAVLGDVVDAALTSITYDYNGYTGTVCDLTEKGNPATSMKVFNKQQHLFLPTTLGSNYYRIPALITAADGSLVAACDKRYNSSSDLGSHKIDVVMRRSTDGGATWTDVATLAEGDGTSDAAYGYGDPSFVKTASGKLICLMAAGKKSFWQSMSNIAMVTSSDNGATWTAPVDITTTAGMLTNNSSKSDWFVTSGKGLCTSDGVIMFLLDADHSAETNLVLYSTDEGATWTIDEHVVATGANEAKLVELESGKLLSSTRNPYSRIFNTGTYTLSEGTCTFSWNTQTTNSTLSQGGSGNNQDVIVYSRNDDGSAKALIHTITTGYGHKTLKLFISLDKGASWNEVMLVQPGGSRYAVTTLLANGDLGVLYEDYSLETGNEYPINFITVTKEQIDAWIEELDMEAYDFDANFNKTFIIKNYNSDASLVYIQSPKFNAAGDLNAYRTTDLSQSAEMLILKDHANDGFFYVFDVKSSLYLKGSENTDGGTAWTFSTTPVTVKLTDNTAAHTDWARTDGHIFLIQNSQGSMANAYEGAYGNQVKNWTDGSDKGSNWYIYITDNSTTSAVYADPTALYYVKNVSTGSYFETGDDGNLTRNTQSTAATYAIIPVKGQPNYFFLYDTQAGNFIVPEETTGNGGQWTRVKTTPTPVRIVNNITNQYMNRASWNPSGIIYLFGSLYANSYSGGVSGLVRNYNAQADKGSHWYLERVDNSTAAVVELKSVTDNIQKLVESAAEVQTQLQYTATVGSAGYGTAVVPFNADVTGDVEAYTASELNGNVIVLNSVSEITANTPVVLKNQGTLSLSAKPATVAYQDNPSYGVLTGVYAATTAEEGSYVLQNQSGQVAFYLVGADTHPTIKPFRAYLTAEANGAKALSFSYGEADGIVLNESDATATEHIYDLQGRKMSGLQRGLNIIRRSNGTTVKVAVK